MEFRLYYGIRRFFLLNVVPAPTAVPYAIPRACASCGCSRCAAPSAGTWRREGERARSEERRTTPQTQTARLPRARGIPAPCGVPTRRVRRTASRAWGASCASRRRRGTGARRRRGLASPLRAQGRTNDRREQNSSHTKPRGAPARLRRREPPDHTIRNEIACAGPGGGRSTGSEDCEVGLGRRFCPGALGQGLAGSRVVAREIERVRESPCA